ncbi:hypothetical protein CDD83_5604 [Cordyceps sp. RAO-2017]|nr:hypothetical protein CDD83_5604 [Cordyceps sp. RAO-2017]
MPPCAADLEAWWLADGREALGQLVDAAELQVEPHECGFAQEVQRRLRAFDNNQQLEAALRSSMLDAAARDAFARGFNPRKKMNEAMRCIFLRPEDGGICHARALDGLEYLDGMETHRRRLVAATKLAMATGPPDEHHPHLVDDLHRQASFRYRQFHMGLRASILMLDLAQDDQQGRKSTAAIMARLNALFPALTVRCGPDDIDLAPYSTGLRDSIRFSVYEHLMSGDALSDHQQRTIQMKLFCWCDMPAYIQAREAMMKYSEEAKRLEDTCLAILGAVERRSSAPVSSAASSSPGTAPERPKSPASADNDDDAEVSQPSLASTTATGSRVASAPPVPNPLLKSVPGREISVAKTDMAAIAGDLDAPPVLAYPHDLSKTEFDQHPLAKELDLTSREKAQLGLLVPKQISRDNDGESDGAGAQASKSPGKKLRGARRLARSRTTAEAPPVPTLPPIPESLRSTLTPKGLGRLFERMKLRPGSPIANPPDTTPSAPRNITAPGSSTLGRGRNRRPALKKHTSNPELQGSGSGVNDQLAKSQGDDGSSSSWVPWSDSPSPGSSFDKAHMKPQEKCRLAEPRLSPMEYTRLYYVEKARADADGRPCHLPMPDKMWHWTAQHEGFLIIPKVPNSVDRSVLGRKPASGGLRSGSSSNSASTVKLDSSPTTCPRLSLNLGGMTALFPSLMNLARLARHPIIGPH